MASLRLAVATVMALALAWFLNWYWLRCYRRGFYWDPRIEYAYRAKRPFWFWFNMAFMGVGAVIMTWGAVYLTFYFWQHGLTPACVSGWDPNDC